MQQEIIELYNNQPKTWTTEHKALFNEFLAALNIGKIRSCEKENGIWKVNEWVKMGILIGFRMGELTTYQWGVDKLFYDKDTLPEKQFSLDDKIRIVPGGSSARNGCYISSGVTIMPPAYINIGAYIDSGTLIDSHSLVGSCAQVGKNVHLSAGAIIGGVLEPIGMRPVIIEDDVFVGGNTGIYEGIIVQSKAVIASGTVITASTPIYDSIREKFLEYDAGKSFTIPANAVVVPGSRRLKSNPDFQIACPIIIKYRDNKTDKAVELEQALRR
ncbi:MAG TPA: 2,3,4,5-tetrahydropyridine-2,6-dicarboxylate N-succinyltransferase [Candidatus Cloacimonas sp.]|nr:2,3,4,5-tetrahydropyridine-2,6-dicarboxylate N-succinyltransferase [Candidatus Cloacimonas sp.]